MKIAILFLTCSSLLTAGCGGVMERHGHLGGALVPKEVAQTYAEKRALGITPQPGDTSVHEVEYRSEHSRTGLLGQIDDGIYFGRSQRRR